MVRNERISPLLKSFSRRVSADNSAHRLSKILRFSGQGHSVHRHRCEFSQNFRLPVIDRKIGRILGGHLKSVQTLSNNLLHSLLYQNCGSQNHRFRQARRMERCARVRRTGKTSEACSELLSAPLGFTYYCVCKFLFQSAFSKVRWLALT